MRQTSALKFEWDRGALAPAWLVQVHVRFGGWRSAITGPVIPADLAHARHEPLEESLIAKLSEEFVAPFRRAGPSRWFPNWDRPVGSASG